MITEILGRGGGVGGRGSVVGGGGGSATSAAVVGDDLRIGGVGAVVVAHVPGQRRSRRAPGGRRPAPRRRAAGGAPCTRPTWSPACGPRRARRPGRSAHHDRGVVGHHGVRPSPSPTWVDGITVSRPPDQVALCTSCHPSRSGRPGSHTPSGVTTTAAAASSVVRAQARPARPFEPDGAAWPLDGSRRNTQMPPEVCSRSARACCSSDTQLAEERVVLLLVGHRVHPLQPRLDVGDAPVEREQLQLGQLHGDVMRGRLAVDPQRLDGELTDDRLARPGRRTRRGPPRSSPRPRPPRAAPPASATASRTAACIGCA